MSKAPEYQLGLLPGFDGPLLPQTPIAFEPPPAPAPPPRRAVSAEREMLAGQVTLAISLDPPDLQGWEQELGRERPRIVNGLCTAIEEWRRLEDGTLGPCPFVACPRHLLIDSGAPIEIGGRRYAELMLNRAGLPATMGRRPALPAVPTDGEIDAFGLEALDRLDEVPDTCSVEVQQRVSAHDGTVDEDGRQINWTTDEARASHADAMQVQEIARAMGVSVEEVRLYTLSACDKIGVKLVNGQPLPGDGARVAAILAQLEGRRVPLADVDLVARARRVLAYLGAPAQPGVDLDAAIARALLTDTSPPPAAIRRIERDAPPPRVPTADEIFGGDW